jgi:hypothetical protein
MKVAFAAVVFALLVFAGSAAAARPTLRLVATSPTKVSGAHFKARERVRVVFDLGAQRFVKVVRASNAGAFTTSAADATFDRCGGSVLIRAIGAVSGAATVKLQLPACAPNP